MCENSEVHAGFRSYRLRQSSWQSEISDQTEHVYGQCRYATRKTWPWKRRVIYKAEVVRAANKEPKDNPRFVVTNLKQSPQWIYEQVYCPRGDVENRLKELHDGMQIGMRPEEVFRIETAKLDFIERTILNPFGKTAAARRKLTMTDEVWSILKRRSISSNSPYVFSSPDNAEKPIGSVRKAHDGAARRAKIAPDFRLYDLRHTYASRAVMGE